MSKNRKKKKRKQPHGSLLFTVDHALREIDKLINSGDLAQALERIKKVAQRAPHRVDIFETIQFVALQADDAKAMLSASLRLAELQPNKPVHHYNLIAAYQTNIFVALVVHTGEYLLERWPDFELDKDLPKSIKKVKEGLKKEAEQFELPEDCWFDLLVLHERVQVALMLNQHEEARRLATELIAKAPQFVAAYNNRSLAAWLLGDFEQAIADARQVLQIEPENIHASGNLTRYLLLTNQQDAARETAKKLKNFPCKKIDDWLKKVEAFSYLGDDAAVDEVAKQAQKQGALMGKYDNPILLHLAGVAAARLGDEKLARKLWKRTLELSSTHTITKANLNDLNQPINERNGAWPFDLNDWFHPVLFREFTNKIAHISNRDDGRAKKVLLDFLQQHPEVNTVIPILLERGNPAGREFALTLAKMSATQEMHEVLQNYAFGPHGPSHLRMQAIEYLKEMGVLEQDKPLQFWADGEQRDVLTLNFKIVDEPYQQTNRKAFKDYGLGIQALKQGDFEQAEAHFRKALAIHPDSASIRFNLAMAKIHQGDFVEGKKMLWTLVEQHPKYGFARIMLATIAIANDRKDEAKELLQSFNKFKQLHFDEFASFCKTQVIFHLISEPDSEATNRWLDMWEQVTPDDPQLPLLKRTASVKVMSRSAARRLLAAYVEK